VPQYDPTATANMTQYSGPTSTQRIG
jgi:hypothetical protein